MKNTFLREEETKRALSSFILSAHKLSMDQHCFEFEEVFARKQGRKEAVLFNSGGSANLALLQALLNLGRLRTGDNVGFSALTWSTNTMPIIQLGMQPVAVDCAPDTLNVMSTNLKERIDEVPMRALFLTNALGFVGDIGQIIDMCRANKILLIEDNCESLGTETAEGKTGNYGLASTFSFFVAHHMSTIEGGMVCTDDEDLAEMLRIVRANGWDRNLRPDQQQKWRSKFGVESEFQSKYTFYELGYNLRPTEITGFLGKYQLQFLDENIRLREANYLKIEKAILANEDLIPLKRDHIRVLSTFAIPIICKTPELREKYLQRFLDAKIESRPMIAGNMQRQPFYTKYGGKVFDLKGADMLHANGFYCGNYPELTDEDLDVVITALQKI